MKAPAESANRAMLLATAYMPLIANSMTHHQPSKVTPMLDEQLPPSDLEKLARDVLGQPPTAALPCNLSDEWLALIARDLDACMGEMTGDDEGGASNYMAAPLALVIHLLHGKANGREKLNEFDEFERYLEDLKVEVHLEVVSRKTCISVQPACLNDIFEDRRVRVERICNESVADTNAGTADPWGSFLAFESKTSLQDDLDINRGDTSKQRDPFEGWPDEGGG
jgi:hypothetical protein